MIDGSKFKVQDGVVIGGLYRHYKGNNYKVLGIVNHSETKEKMVCYKALYGEELIWVRPLEMFLEKVECKSPSGETALIDRFKFMELSSLPHCGCELMDVEFGE